MPADPKAELIRFTDEDRVAATKTAADIDKFVLAIRDDERELAASYVKLGVLLLRVRSTRYWLLWDFDSFGKYIESIRERVQKGRTQLYQCLGIAEKLLPIVGEEKLIQMGVSKAGELKRVMALTGRAPSEELVEKAINDDVGLQEVRAAAFEEAHAKPDKPGAYWDMGGFFLTPDERKEIEAAFDVARRTDPPIDQELPEWAQRKEIILRLSREYYGTYCQQVQQGDG